MALQTIGPPGSLEDPRKPYDRAWQALRTFARPHLVPPVSELLMDLTGRKRRVLIGPEQQDDLEIDAFLHCNDLTYEKDSELELKKYKKGENKNHQ